MPLTYDESSTCRHRPVRRLCPWPARQGLGFPLPPLRGFLEMIVMRSELLALRAGHVFDGVDVRQSGMVLVEDGVILDVDFTGAAAPGHAAGTDFGPDAWLLPGLIDAHVHLCWDGTTDAVAHVASGDRETVLGTGRAGA